MKKNKTNRTRFVLLITTFLFVGAAALILAAAPTVWSGEPEKLPVGPRLKPFPAAKKLAADPEKDLFKKASEAARRYCVGVSISFTPPPSDDRELKDLHPSYRRMLERYRRMSTLLHEGGVVIGPDRVLVDITFLRPEDVESIEVVTSAGKKHTAVPAGLLDGFRGYVLKVDTSSGKLDAPRFNGKPPTGLGDMHAVGYMYRRNCNWMIQVSVQTVTSKNADGDTRILGAGSSNIPSLLLDKDGKPYGVSTSWFLWREKNNRTSYDGTDIQRGKQYAIKDVLGLWEKFRDDIAPNTLPLVTFVFRPEVEEDDQPGYGYYSGSGLLDEVKLYGVFLDGEGTLLVPHSFTVERTKLIDRITVKYGETTSNAHFEGNFQNFEGILLTVKDFKASAAPAVRRSVSAQRGRLFYTAQVSHSYGGRHIYFTPNRVSDFHAGLEDKPVPSFMESMGPGGFLIDPEGCVVGFKSQEYSSGPKGTKQAASASRKTGYPRFFFFNDLAEVFDLPGQHFDPAYKVLTREQAKKSAWLGVEYQSMQHDLAKHLEILDSTKNGMLGMLVVHIYPGSPAKRLNLRKGDILLSVKPVDEKSSYELTGYGGGYRGYRPSYGYGGRSRYGGGRMAPTPWRNRKNTLTELMTWIGKDRRIEISFLRKTGTEGYETKTVSLTIEDAPADFNSAEKYKDEALGFTMKELTYEARFFHKLPEDAQGVVVSKVETGSAAEIAKLRTFEIVRQVDGVPIRSLDHFKGLIAEALKDESKKTIRFLVERYGKTRFADLEKK
ncbi:MAG: PDZ domain-containing protein [Planctomycetota bacterium]|nr:MAG: PDZ domain-containing protein [Planctomycetota bacterium]